MFFILMFQQGYFCDLLIPSKISKNNLLDTSWTYLGHYLKVYKAYIGHIYCMSMAYYGHKMRNLGHAFCISWVYIGHILVISLVYLGHISVYFRHILSISWSYPKNEMLCMGIKWLGDWVIWGFKNGDWGITGLGNLGS